MALCIAVATPGVNAQFNLKKAIRARKQAAKAFTLTDKQMAEYVKESVDWMDEHNPVPDENNAYTIRLRKLTGDLKEVTARRSSRDGRAHQAYDRTLQRRRHRASGCRKEIKPSDKYFSVFKLS